MKTDLLNKKKHGGFAGRVVRTQEFLIACVLVVLWTTLGLINPGFTSAANLLTIIKSLSFYGIIAIGMSFVMISGDIDISVGSMAAFGSVFSCWMMLATKCFGMQTTQMEWLGIVLCIAITMAVACIIGTLNALMVVKLNLPAFIATVATKYSLQGLVMILTDGTPVYPLPDSFNTFGKEGIDLGGNTLSVFFLIMVGLMIAAAVLLRKTKYGRNIYATGSNRVAAKLAGINTNRVRFSNFIILAALAAFSGSLNAAYIGQGSTQIGINWELMVIATCAMGGVKMEGGAGGMLGVLFGLFIINSLNGAIAMIGINTFLQDVMIGVVLILVVVFEKYREGRKIRA